MVKPVSGIDRRAARPGDGRIEIDGTCYPLSLTLAALAEIEAALEAYGFAALSDALKSLNARSLCLVLTALLRAGGAKAAERLAARAEPASAARAVADCFMANLA